MLASTTSEKRIKERERIFSDRKRTNIFKVREQQLIQFLLPKIPSFISPNILTGIGMFGSVIILLAFLLAKEYDRNFLLLGIVGLAINWFGDSLDGRLAYYLNIPRKWYGFALDVIMDWISIILIGLGYHFYAPDPVKILGFLFVVFYGWAMIISQLRYKIEDIYKIDSGLFGPTELRVIIAFILILECIFPSSITYAASIITAFLLAINVIDTFKLLKIGNERDRKEKKE